MTTKEKIYVTKCVGCGSDAMTTNPRQAADCPLCHTPNSSPLLSPEEFEEREEEE